MLNRVVCQEPPLSEQCFVDEQLLEVEYKAADSRCDQGRLEGVGEHPRPMRSVTGHLNHTPLKYDIPIRFRGAGITKILVEIEFVCCLLGIPEFSVRLKYVSRSNCWF